MPRSASSKNYTYLLGDSSKEAACLKAQAKLWDPVSLALFDRLRIKRGWKILEIGPGAGSLHMELRRRTAAPVDVVERSPVFAEHIARLSKRDGFGAGRIWQCDLLDADLPRNHYDLIFVRWVFLFLPDPLAHLRLLTRALKPGGRIAIQDYYRDSLGMVPTPPEWPAFLAADVAFFASQGGHASIGAKLPEMYRKAGLSVESVVPTIKSGTPGTPAWNWMSTYFYRIMDEYAKFPPFTPAMARSLTRQWHAAEREKTSLLISPAVLDVVGRKKRGK